jgi:hypothetical protein
VALLFQGSVFGAESFWAALDTDIFGYMNQGLAVATLLDDGFAVVTPEAHLDGWTAWDTNIPPQAYLDRLIDRGHDADAIFVSGVGHAWIDGAGDQLVEWFRAH